MTASDLKRGLGEWLQEAYATGTDCPSIEILAEAAAGHLSPAELAEVDAHVSVCAACSGEWELARLFAADEAEIADHQNDVDFVTSGLEESFGSGAKPSRPADSMLLQFPDPAARRPRIQLLARIAAVLVLVVGLGAIVQNLGTGSPTLPTSGPDDVLRSAAVEIVAPRGEIAVVPKHLTWRAHPDATTYRVRVIAVDETVLLETVVSSTALEVPDTVRDRFRPLAVYHWQVEALGEDQTLVAWSETTTFRILGD